MIINTEIQNRIVIYENGTQYNTISMSSTSYITFGTDHIEVRIANTKKAAFCTSTPIYISGCTKLCIKRSRTSSQSGNKSYLGFSSTMSTTQEQPDVFNARTDSTNKDLAVFAIDISSVSDGAYYLKWYGEALGTSQALDNQIYGIWLE